MTIDPLGVDTTTKQLTRYKSGDSLNGGAGSVVNTELQVDITELGDNLLETIVTQVGFYISISANSGSAVNIPFDGIMPGDIVSLGYIQNEGISMPYDTEVFVFSGYCEVPNYLRICMYSTGGKTGNVRFNVKAERYL